MNRGGQFLNHQAVRTIRTAGFIVPLILVFYAVLVVLGIADNSSMASPFWFNATLIAWSTLTIAHLMLDTHSHHNVAWLLVAYHILIIPYAMFVSGFVSPFLVGWLILLLASYIYFGNRGVLLSYTALIIIAGFELIFHGDNLQSNVETLFTLTSIMGVGAVVFGLTRIQEVDWHEFIRNQEEGALERNKVTAIINNLNDAVICTDADGIIEVYNAATLNLLDTNESLIGRHVDEIVKLFTAENRRVKLTTGMRRHKTASITRDDLSLHFDDAPVRVEMVRTQIRSGFRPEGDDRHDYIFSLRDITRTKSLEEEKDEFISVVSHELRTPLTIAEGTLSNLEIMMDRPDIGQSVVRQNAEIAHEQVIFLAKMVNDLSTLSRAERGIADTPELIEVKTMISDLYKEYEPRASRKNLAFNLDTDTNLGYINASPLYIKELLQNFITNAIKYTKKGSVTISVKKDGNQLTFAVSDTGIGISKADQAKIYDKFFRSEDYRTRETRGTGLGLYVAVKLARKLGTHISLVSRLNHGSEFSFIIPAENAKK